MEEGEKEIYIVKNKKEREGRWFRTWRESRFGDEGGWFGRRWGGVLKRERLLFGKDQPAFWSVGGCCLKWSDEGFFRAFEDAVWEEISRRFEGIIGCCSHKDQFAFSESEEFLFEMIRRESFESMQEAISRDIKERV